LNEGLAEYFATLCAKHEGGEEVFDDVIRQMRRWAVQYSDEGPVYLGYRLGHLERELRVFRALVYNKGAMVLHIFRGLMGGDAFFVDLRHFYKQWCFQKAATDDFQLAFEIDSNRSLSRFLDRWIHEATLPELRSLLEPRQPQRASKSYFNSTNSQNACSTSLDLHYQSDEAGSELMAVTERATGLRVPSHNPLQRTGVDDKGTTLAEINH